jgi:RNA polymerase sigma-70 factor (ECF subfamily)
MRRVNALPRDPGSPYGNSTACALPREMVEIPMPIELRKREQEASEADDFELFFEAEQARLFRALVLVTGDPHEAEDLLQEAFVRVWERWDRVSRLANPVGYLHRTAINALRSRYRHAVYVAKRRLLFASTPPDALVAVEDRDAALRALLALTRRQRAAVILTALLGYTTEEAAVALSIRPGTVHVLLSQARARMRGMEDAQDE